jgi:hypothetical protein
LIVPVKVYGYGGDRKIFHEETATLVVNAHGCLFPLKADVGLEDIIVVVSTATQQEARFRVAYRNETENGQWEVGAAFMTPSPRFWGMAFPPDDWDPTERKLPPRRRT